MRRIVSLLYLVVLILLVVPAAALADSANHTQPLLALPSDQAWTLAIGALVPIVTYLLNHRAPWVSEPVKGAVLVVVSAVAGGLYKALANGDVGLNGPTLEYVITAVGAALFAHHFFYKPAEWSVALGGGTNSQDVTP